MIEIERDSGDHPVQPLAQPTGGFSRACLDCFWLVPRMEIQFGHTCVHICSSLSFFPLKLVSIKEMYVALRREELSQQHGWNKSEYSVDLGFPDFFLINVFLFLYWVKNQNCWCQFTWRLWYWRPALTSGESNSNDGASIYLKKKISDGVCLSRIVCCPKLWI